MNTSLSVNKINLQSKEFFSNTYGKVRSLNWNPGGKCWEDEQMRMNVRDFIKSNIQELTEKYSKNNF